MLPWRLAPSRLLAIALASALTLTALLLTQGGAASHFATRTPATNAPHLLIPIPTLPSISSLFPAKTLITLEVLGDLRVLVPAGAALYADGNRAMARIADLVYSRGCREHAGLVIDVGGLIGDFSVRAAAAGCQVITFEPQARFAALIRATAELNGLSRSVTVVAAAVGEEHDTELRMAVGAQPGATSFRAVAQQAGAQAVRSYRLDQALPADARVLLLKIDVEGSDVGALLSAEALLRAGRVHHAVFEFSAFWKEPGQGRWREVLSWLAALPTPPRLYALHRKGVACFGPLREAQFDEFHSDHIKRRQTDVWVVWEEGFEPGCEGPWVAGAEFDKAGREG